MSIYDFEMKTIDGQDTSLRNFDGKVLVVVNVASKCGLTPHYGGLQKLYEDYQGRGLEILGFPCNQFGGQEPGSETEIQEFCSTSYGVTFPMFAKLDVNGPDRAKLYEWMTSQDTAPDGAGDIVWNFAKFVIGRDGEIVARFDPSTEPGSDKLIQAVEKAIG